MTRWVDVPWPAEWTPLAQLRPMLIECMHRHNEKAAIYDPDPAQEIDDWRWLPFGYWLQYKVEYRGAPGDAEGRPRILLHPTAERYPHLYDLDEFSKARLAYPRRDPSYFDLHFRKSPLAPDRKGITDQRAELMQAVWVAQGRPQWTAPQAHAAAQQAYPGHPVFGDRTERVWRDAWRVAQSMLRD